MAFDPHCFTTWSINGATVLLGNQAVSTRSVLQMDYPGKTLVLIEPLVAQNDVIINATTIIALNSIHSLHGGILIHGTKYFIDLSREFNSDSNVTCSGDRGSFTPPFIPVIRDFIVNLFREGLAQNNELKISTALLGAAQAAFDPTPAAEVTHGFDLPRCFELLSIPHEAPTHENQHNTDE